MPALWDFLRLKKLEANLPAAVRLRLGIQRAFREVDGVDVPSVRPDANPAWHLYPIRVNPARLTADRGQIFRALRAENIGVNVHYIPVHLHPYLS